MKTKLNLVDNPDMLINKGDVLIFKRSDKTFGIIMVCPKCGNKSTGPHKYDKETKTLNPSIVHDKQKGDIMIEDIIKILETDFEWNKKNENGFSETQKMIIADTIEAIQVQARVMPNEVLAGEKFKKVLIDLVVSNYLLGVAEYNRNPSYNDQHFHHKAEIGFLDYVEEYDLELWGEIQNRLNELENDSQHEA